MRFPSHATSPRKMYVKSSLQRYGRQCHAPRMLSTLMKRHAAFRFPSRLMPLFAGCAFLWAVHIKEREEARSAHSRQLSPFSSYYSGRPSSTTLRGRASQERAPISIRRCGRAVELDVFCRSPPGAAFVAGRRRRHYDERRSAELPAGDNSPRAHYGMAARKMLPRAMPPTRPKRRPRYRRCQVRGCWRAPRAFSAAACVRASAR